MASGKNVMTVLRDPFSEARCRPKREPGNPLIFYWTSEPIAPFSVPKLLSAFGLKMPEIHGQLSGLGGFAHTTIIQAELRFLRDDGQPILFRGLFAAVIDPEALDISILGRDITDLFATIVDRPGNVVCLLGQHHRYRIEYTGS